MSFVIDVRVRHDGLLEPLSQRDKDTIGKLPAGCEVHLTGRKGRSNAQLKMWWATLDALIAHTAAGEKWRASEQMSDGLLLSCGYGDPIFVPGEGMVFRPPSIALMAMDQEKFNRFFDEAMGKVEDAFNVKIEDVLRQARASVEVK